MPTPAPAYQGAKSSIGTSAVQLTTTSTPVTYGVTIKAAAANSDNVYVGLSSGVTNGSADATDGYQLQASGEVFIPAAVVPGQDASKVYVIGGAAGQKVFWIAS